MPELPEVEVTRRSLLPPTVGKRVLDLAVHETRFRWPIDEVQLRTGVVQRVVSYIRVVDRRGSRRGASEEGSVYGNSFFLDNRIELRRLSMDRVLRWDDVVSCKEKR